jgi:GST-like protein
MIRPARCDWGDAMIDLYTFGTGNGLRGSIALAEAGLDHRIHLVDIHKGESRTPKFLKLNPAGSIPVLVDDSGPGGEPITLSQSGAIILYVAEKCGRFLPKDAALRAATLQWFMMATSDVSGGHTAIFMAMNRVPEKHAANTEFWETRLADHLRVFDKRLDGRDYLMGAEPTVADIALFPPVSLRLPLVEKAGGCANVLRWFKTMSARPGVQKGLKLA